MAEIALAFYWHQHQPYYPDDVTGENPMPWVRLHGVKDYYGMALHLLEFPQMRCTINLVPSLVRQILAYTENDATDRPLQVSKLAANDLCEEDAIYLLDHFFMANTEQMIKPMARYFELFHRRAGGQNTAKQALRRFNERDFRDLQVLFNLAWIHPIAFERDTTLQELKRKGKYYSEGDKQTVLAKHLEILRQVLPLHRQLAAAGQVELTTTPYFHPILPLLFDKKLAKEAMPDVKLPRYTGGYPEDAAIHVKRAVDQHRQVFGEAPKGMWPAEGSVCQAMIPLLAQHGIRWIATDEEILSHSTQEFVGRDASGHVRNPGLLYRPYRVREGDHDLAIVFRDHALSDMIGFHYQRSPGSEAAADFVRHLRNIREAVPEKERVMVNVILDGENCWEHYPGGGVEFLRLLYTLCTTTPGIRPVKIGDYLTEQPPTDTLARLFSGSWIYHNFAIWIGHDEDNTAWDLLHQTREMVRHHAALPHTDPEALRKAWEEIYIAEGSDWFWWYGDDHSSAQDELFDTLFRKHLQNAYIFLGQSPPRELSRPIKRAALKAMHTQPIGFLKVNVDGRETFFEWINAGRYLCRNERGTMAMVSQGPLREVRFGFDRETLFIRVDFDQPASLALQAYDALRIGFEEPPGFALEYAPHAAENERWNWSMGDHRFGPIAGIRGAVDRIVEVAIPLATLGLEVGAPVHFYVDLQERGQSRDRAPREGAIHTDVPPADFERKLWDV